MFKMKADVLKVLWRRDGPYPEEIRVVRWILNGKPTVPKLEYRHKAKVGEKGFESHGRCAGFTLDHLTNIIAPNIEEIVRIMREADQPNPTQFKRKSALNHYESS